MLSHHEPVQLAVCLLITVTRLKSRLFPSVTIRRKKNGVWQCSYKRQRSKHCEKRTLNKVLLLNAARQKSESHYTGHCMLEWFFKNAHIHMHLNIGIQYMHVCMLPLMSSYLSPLTSPKRQKDVWNLSLLLT